MCVTLVFNTKGQRYLRVGLAVPLFGSVSNLRSMVAEEGSISSNQVRARAYVAAEHGGVLGVKSRGNLPASVLLYIRLIGDLATTLLSVFKLTSA